MDGTFFKGATKKMRKTTGLGAVALLQLGLHACTPSTNVPGTDLYIEAADGKYHGPMESIRIEPANATLEVSLTQGYSAIGVFEDGTEVAVTEKVYWQVADEGVAAKAEGFEGGVVSLTGMTTGQIQIDALLGTLRGNTNLEVVPAALMSLSVSRAEGVPDVLRATDTYAFKVQGTYRDNHIEDLTEQATWSSSDASVLEVMAPGQVKVAKVGEASVIAQVGEVEGSLSLSSECRYFDDAPEFIGQYETMPHLYWENAQDKDGNVVRFDFEDVMCDASWQDVKTLVFQVSAVWCGPCNRRLPITAGLAPQLSELGSRVFYVEAEDLQGRPIGTVAAAEHIDSIIPDGLGLRLGGRDSKPTANIFHASPGFLEAFPTIFVVRTSDMKMIANSMDSAVSDLDLLTIAEHPDWIWTDPDNPVQAFENKCEPGQDESYEPNDEPAQAAEIGPGVIEGGICTFAPDFYRINIEGNWRVTVLYDIADANIDVAVWNEATNGALISGGREVGGFTTTSNEAFEFHGKQLIKVYGTRAGSAPYRLFVEAI